jgi:hypothetical protein
MDPPLKITYGVQWFLICAEEISTLVGDRDLVGQELENSKIPSRYPIDLSVRACLALRTGPAVIEGSAGFPLATDITVCGFNEHC